MKVTRSYWVGLGSGLILSAMLTLVMFPNQQQVVTLKDSSSVPIAKQQATTPPLVNGTKQADQPSTAQSAQGQSPNAQKSTQIEQNFSIPNGASSERIADLLVTQGFIKDKEPFLVVSRQMGVESQFRAGTFILSQGLTTQELINRLLKK